MSVIGAHRELHVLTHSVPTRRSSDHVVHKTASASLDEGSLGAVVDLNTGNPLGGKEGFTAVASVQGRYNDLTKDVDPRLAGLIAWTNADRTFGVSASVAWADYKTHELGDRKSTRLNSSH